MRAQKQFVVIAEGHAHRWLVDHSIATLRVTMGLVFLGFGALKFIPGASPAQDLALSTTEILTFHTVPDPVALIGIASLETVIGLSLILGRGLRLTIYLLAAELLGILSPLILLTERLFPSPWHTPTLEGQYVLKDIVLVGAAMVVATTFRGARITLGPDGAAPGRGGVDADTAGNHRESAHQSRIAASWQG